MDRVAPIQVVPGHRVSVRGRWVAACLGCLAGALLVSRLQNGPDDVTALATVRARPEPVSPYDYDASAADGALRGVADTIMSSDRYKREMVQSSLLWLVCVPIIVVAFYCARGACCASPEAAGLYEKRVPTATATYGSAFSSAVAPAEVLESDDDDGGDARDDLPAASAVSLGVA